MNRRTALFLMAGAGCAALAGTAGYGAEKQTFYTPPSDLQQDWRFLPDAKLPNVLLIGDSISIGYTIDVRTMLRGRANVLRPMEPNGLAPANCGNTRRGLEELTSWLGSTKWAVIHFNWGLHDLCYLDPQPNDPNHRDKVHGKQEVPLPQYRKNLELLVERLEQTGAALLWAATTVVPEGEAGRFVGDDVKYNRVAAEVMAGHRIQTDDLYALTRAFAPELHREPGNVHFTQAGYAVIAKQVAAQIEFALAKRATAPRGRSKIKG